MKRAVLVTLCAVFATSAGADPDCEFDPRTELERAVAAHGGLHPWQALKSLSIERTHSFAGRDQHLDFRIHGDYPAHRLYLEWNEPAGQVTWDGERAWSVGWPLAAVFLPRFVTTIGFTLVNFPWLAAQDALDVTSKGCRDGLPGRETERFHVVSVVYEPEPSRKPVWFEGERNRYELFIGQQDGRLAAVMQHWTHAGQLDAWRLPPEQAELLQLVVFESHTQAGGLLLPARYSAYTASGELAATGEFGPYAIDAPFDPAWMTPPAGAVQDGSSSYRRNTGFHPAEP